MVVFISKLYDILDCGQIFDVGLSVGEKDCDMMCYVEFLNPWK